MTDARQVSTDEGRELAEHYNVRFLETSAKDCKNVEEAFIMMTREIKSRVAITQPKAKTATSGGKLLMNLTSSQVFHISFNHFLIQIIYIGSETTKLGPSKPGQSKKLTEKKNGCC